MFASKIVSSLEKCFIDEALETKTELTEMSVMKNETFAIQFIYRRDGVDSRFDGFADIEVKNDFGGKVTVRTVEQVISLMPVIADACDDGYISKKPGLFPDLLLPLHHGGKVPVCENETRAVWIEFEPEEGFVPGKHSVTVKLTLKENTLKNTLHVNVVPAELPEQTLMVTQWFHYDCLASYYDTEVFSERHWRIIENYIRTAVRNGNNMILTPIFTPPLDTQIGGERKTVQLVGVKVTDNGYEFDFSRLHRFIEMCKRCGVKYYEISHLFTQWGACHAPKIVADVDGEEKKIFGWETDSCGEDYRAFLAALLPKLITELKAEGIDQRCRFHISDEPHGDQIEKYKQAKSGVEKLLEGYKIMDALSDIEFYNEGVITSPVPACDHIEPFYEAKVPELWTYYCLGQHTNVPNRFIALPSYRNRIIGFLFYKYNVAGFLQWGYNFYNNQWSVDPINPYISSSCEYFGQSGDAFSVWPAQNGEAYESIRIRVFHEGINDMRALQLCERLYGREYTVKLLEEGLERPLKFKDFPKSAEYIRETREKINRAIEEKVGI